MSNHISRILIIDDDPALLMGLADMLRQRLWRIDVETRSEAAFAIPMAQSGHYDLILCDCWMPQTNGLELLPRLREVTPATAIVMMTGTLNDTVRHTALSCRATKVLAKPFDRQSITITLKQLLKDHHLTHRHSATDM